MDVIPSSDNPGDNSVPERGRLSFLHSVFGWLSGRSERPRSDPVCDVDAYFSAVGAGQAALPSAPGVASQESGGRSQEPGIRGLTASGKPPSPLAAAYARSAESTRPPPLPSPSPTAQWKVVEPAASSDPVAHQECRFARRSESWSLIGASIRGKLHAHHGVWRDDAFAWGTTQDWTCIAVADGAGSASLSRVGARVACDEGVRALTEALGDFRLGPESTPSQEDLQRLRGVGQRGPACPGQHRW